MSTSIPQLSMTCDRATIISRDFKLLNESVRIVYDVTWVTSDMAEEGAPIAEGSQPAAAAQGTDSSTGYDYRKIHSYPLIKVSKCVIVSANTLHSDISM